MSVTAWAVLIAVDIALVAGIGTILYSHGEREREREERDAHA